MITKYGIQLPVANKHVTRYANMRAKKEKQIDKENPSILTTLSKDPSLV